MPGADGTGPLGLGPGTGRRRGWCGQLLSYTDRSVRRRLGLLAVAAPVAVALVRDLTNPVGLLRSVCRRTLGNKRNRRGIRVVDVENEITTDRTA